MHSSTTPWATLNTATGHGDFIANTDGVFNTAIGATALLFNTMGSNNTAIGLTALHSNTTGNNNIGLGLTAGFNLTTGSNNIDIGNPGVAGESNTIRIGKQELRRPPLSPALAERPCSGEA